MTTAVIVTRGATDVLIRCLDSLAACVVLPERTVVFTNDDESNARMADGYGFVTVVRSPENVGFWRGINAGIEALPDDERFCYFGKDVFFAPDWLERAERCYALSFPTGLGLLCFRDDIQHGFSAAHGMATKRWLRVVFGERFFPAPPYMHFFCDSEFSQRSKDMGQYVYCPESYVRHEHQQTGFASSEAVTHTMHNDKLTEGARYRQWVQGEHALASQRLASLMPPCVG